MEAITFQCALEVYLVGRLTLENIRCSHYAFCCPKTYLLDTLHYSLSRHMCHVCFIHLESSHPVLVILHKVLGYDGQASLRPVYIITHARKQTCSNCNKEPQVQKKTLVVFAIWFLQS